MKDFLLVLPEIFLVLTLVFVVAGEITYHGERTRLITATALLGLGGAFIQALMTYQYGASEAFNHALAIDGLSLFFKLFFISLSALAIVAASHSREVPERKRGEYTALIIASCLAMCFAASSSDLLLAFLALQLLNVLAYFLSGFSTRSLRSTEAAVKYLIFCTLAGALFMYGAGILFAFAHSLNLSEIHRALVAQPLPRETMLVVFVLIFFSFAFQLGAFPMHLWAPDVFEGAPTPISGFLSVGTKATGFALAIRGLLVIFAQASTTSKEAGQWEILGTFDWTELLALISGLSLIVGPLLALRQNSAKRMVGCLAIAESGFLLIGVLVLDQVGLAALLYNLMVGLFALVGTFYVLSFCVNEMGSDRLEDLKGMLRKAPPECIGLLIFLACLVGIPPAPGFIGKFTLIGVALHHHWPVLAFIAIGSRIMGAAALARLSFTLVGDFQTNRARAIVPSLERKAFLASLLIPTLISGIFANTLLEWMGRSLGFIAY